MERIVSFLIEYPDREFLAINLAHKIKADLRAALRKKKRAVLVVPGGKTPGPIFDALCTADIEWARVDIMLSDERWVPETNDRSNTKLLRERLLVGRASSARFIPFFLPSNRPEDVIDQLNIDCEFVLPIAVLLLGMGVDMHTASLFPAADRLPEAFGSQAPLLLPVRVDGGAEPRVTFTARVLNAAPRKHLVILGEDKRRAFEKSKTLSFQEAPIKAVMQDLVVHWAA